MGSRSIKSLLRLTHDSMVFKGRVARLADHIAAIIPTGGTVLDVGCGDGTVAMSVTAQRADLRFEGVDIMERPSCQIPMRVYDGTTLPFDDDSFDFVTIVDVLHHTDGPAVVLKEAVRVAKAGVVVKDPNVHHLILVNSNRFEFALGLEHVRTLGLEHVRTYFGDRRRLIPHHNNESGSEEELAHHGPLGRVAGSVERSWSRHFGDRHHHRR